MPFKNPHPLYQVWRSMRDRCLNPNYRQWNDYGGRGIKICSRWDDFHAFVEDMGPRPKGYSLDRIDNDGDYTPENCRWASRKEQQRNQRVTRYVTIEGQQYRAVDLADKAGVKTDTIVSRAERGLPMVDVLRPDAVVDEAKRAKSIRTAIAAHSAKSQARTHCRNGHPFTDKNTYIRKDGYRQCRTCHNAKMRRLNEKKRRAQASY